MAADNLKLPHLRMVVMRRLGDAALDDQVVRRHGRRGAPRLGHDRDEPDRHARRAEAAVRRTHRRRAARHPADPGLPAVRRRDEDHRRCRQGTAVGRQDLRPAQGARPRGREGLFPGRHRHPRRRRLLRHRRRRHHRPARLHADHRPLQGRHQVRRRMDFLDRPGKPRGRPSRGRGSRRDRRPSSEMGRAAAADRRSSSRARRRRARTS